MRRTKIAINRFKARYSGTCSAQCGVPIQPGMVIKAIKGRGIYHDNCEPVKFILPARHWQEKDD